MIKPYYEDDSVKIYHGDCNEILPDIKEDISLCLTDPPYEIHADGSGMIKDRKYIKDIKGFTDCGFDYNILKQFKNWFCFGTLIQVPELINIAQNQNNRWMLITWNKPNPVPLINKNYLPDTEYIIHSFKNHNNLYGEYEDRRRYIVHRLGDKQDGTHPNEKPLNVIYKLVKLGTQEGMTIIDPYAGSCTTGRASKDLGRKCICIEKEEKYCEIGAKRLFQQVFNFRV
jgi:site-specific DNA-methyltransferase (adenine-specific)